VIRHNNEAFLESAEFPFYAAPCLVKSGEFIPAHSHEFVELAYIASGCGEHQYNQGEFHRISEGDVFMIEPGVEHAYRVDSQNQLLVYNILFDPSLLKTEIEALSTVTSFIDFYYVEPFLRNKVHFNAHLSLKPYQQVEIKTLLDRLIMEFKDKKIGYRILTKTRMIELFVFLSRYYQEIESPLKLLDTDERVMHYIQEFINIHYAQPLTLAQISQLCGMSASSFSVKFKHCIGHTFIEYRNEVRILMAQKFLTKTNLKIASISQEVGFEDLSFFNKIFKKITGLSPSDFRKRK
jgi:AraC-like DNA-binding protein